MDGDGRGGEGGGVFDIFGGGGAGGGDGGGGGGDVGGGWRRASSARGRIPAAGEANPAAGTRHEESNLEPRQLGAAGADHHRGRGAQPPCQAAPPHRQTGQATAERAAQRRQPNGGVRPGGPTADSLICAADLPNSGTAPPMVQPESPAALLTCLGRHTAARPPAADGSPTYPESGPADAPGDLRFGCPEPCTRQANPPEHQGPISDFQASKRARCAGRPDFGLGGRRPQVQNLGRDRLRPFGRGRGWGKVSRPPPWKRANLATRRARGGAMACSAVGRRTGRDPRIRQTNTSSDAGGDPFFRYRACPVDLPCTLGHSHSPLPTLIPFGPRGGGRESDLIGETESTLFPGIRYLLRFTLSTLARATVRESRADVNGVWGLPGSGAGAPAGVWGGSPSRGLGREPQRGAGRSPARKKRRL